MLIFLFVIPYTYHLCLNVKNWCGDTGIIIWKEINLRLMHYILYPLDFTSAFGDTVEKRKCVQTCAKVHARRTFYYGWLQLFWCTRWFLSFSYLTFCPPHQNKDQLLPLTNRNGICSKGTRTCNNTSYSNYDELL